MADVKVIISRLIRMYLINPRNPYLTTRFYVGNVVGGTSIINRLLIPGCTVFCSRRRVRQLAFKNFIFIYLSSKTNRDIRGPAGARWVRARNRFRTLFGCRKRPICSVVHFSRALCFGRKVLKLINNS